MEAAKLIYDMETQLIHLVIKYLLTGKTESAKWQAQRLAALGNFRRDAIRLIGRNSKAAQKELARELERAWKFAAGEIDSAVKGIKAVLPFSTSQPMREILTIWDRNAATELGRTSAKLLASALKQYTDTVELATAKALVGSSTVRQAIAEAAGKWGEKGLPALTDAAGRKWSAEAYAQTVVRSNVRQVTTQTQLARMDEYGLDLVEVSSHNGARPGCAPYQGRVYSLHGKTPGYPLLSSTSMGEPSGLFGINCGHRMYPYVPGTRKTYQPYPARENENTYEESQDQRRLERGIRQAKREYSILDAAGADKAELDRAKEKINNRQEAMRNFIGETDRTRRYDREQIYG